MSKYDKNKLQIHSQQKHAICIIYCKDKFSHTKECFVQNKVFNLYQLSALNNLIFMHKVKRVITLLYLNITLGSYVL